MGGSEGWQSPPARGHAELSTTAWSGATEQKAISCLMRGLANEEGTEPLETLLGSVPGERDAAPAEMWSTGLCTSKQIWISQHHSKMEPQHPHHCHPWQGGTWEYQRVVAHQNNPSHARGGLGWGRQGISLLPPSPSPVSKQECLNAFYVVTQMMKGLKMGLTKTSCTSE